MKINVKTKCLLILIVAQLFLISPAHTFAQVLNSDNYTLQDPNLNGTSGIVDSGSNNYSTVFVAGDGTADVRLESGSYSVGTGFPNGIQANIPLIRCIETNSDDTVGGSTDTECNAYALTSTTVGDDAIVGDGMQGICGSPGCYDRAKIEIDPQNNPIDTLYLISITNSDTGIVYYLQSDKTLNTTYDINDYQTICELEGFDPRAGSDCEDSGDSDWDEVLQQYNILNLTPGTTYSVKVRALHGDFTESNFSPVRTVTTEYSSLIFDIDIAASGGASTDTDAPHNLQLGNLSNTTSTAVDRVWFDLGTNVFNGINLKVENTGLSNGSFTIPSTSEDLSVDIGADGGYGLKIDTYTQDALGPLIADAQFDTLGIDEVGAVSVVPTTLFSTNSTGFNKGPLSGGRASVMLKAKTVPSTPPGSYTDIITFTITANP